MYNRIAVLVALPEELKGIANTFYTNVGKVNATMKTLQVINEFNPDMIINYGTAGTVNNKHSGLVEVDVIVQRDMITEPQAPRGVTPFEKDNTAGPIMLNTGTNITLGTGDSFVQQHDPWFEYANIDIVDMEAYGIAKVCQLNNTPFKCFKYVTDFADKNAMENWTENVSNGQQAFTKKFSQYDAQMELFEV